MKPTVENCRIVELPKITDARGNLTFIESCRHIPFEIKRVYYLYDVPGGVERGGHGHKKLEQLMIAIAGSFDVTVNDGRKSKNFHLNRSYFGLYIPRMMWRHLHNFSSSAVCLNLASDFYKEEDYFRDFDEFVKVANEPQL